MADIQEPTTIFSLERIHNFEIIGQLVSLNKRSRALLIDRGPSYTDRYVTAIHWVGDNEWDNGNYFTDRLKAIQDFIDRGIHLT